MKPRSALPTVVWALLGMLVIAALALSMGKENGDAFPSVASYGPSGSKAFYHLLQQEGYRPSFTNSARPWLDGSPILIAFTLSAEDEPAQQSTNEFIEDYLKNGGRAIVFQLDSNFEAESERAKPETNFRQVLEPGTTLTVSEAESETPSTTRFDEPDANRDLSADFVLTIDAANTPQAILEVKGRGLELKVPDGIIATNRFVGQNQNADQLIRWVRTIAPKSSDLLFMEASFGNGSEPGIFDAMGRWSYAAWLEILFLFVVVIYTMGKPFGYPDERKFRQRGARDLVEAVAFLYRRAKATGPVLNRAYEDADHEIRNRLKLPSDASVADRDRRLPEALARELMQTKQWSEMRVNQIDALRQLRRLDALLSEFLGSKRPARRRQNR